MTDYVYAIAAVLIAGIAWDAWCKKVALDHRKVVTDEAVQAIRVELTAIADKAAVALALQVRDAIGLTIEGDPPIVDRVRRLEALQGQEQPMRRVPAWQAGR